MNKTIFIIAIVFAALIGGGYLLINKNPQIKSLAEKYGVIDAPDLNPLPASYNAVFCIFDPSGSGKSTYSVPIISVEFIQQLISSIADKGYGELWLTYVDRSAMNNKVLHFIIPEKMKSFEPPVRKTGELKGEFDRRLAVFRADSIKINKLINEEMNNYSKSKALFLKECNEMIIKGYTPKKSYEDYSDVVGSLNAASRSLRTVVNDTLHFSSILLISDGVQDIPSDDLKQQLKEMPKDVILVLVNHSGSANSIIAEKAIEVDNLDRGIEKTMRVYNHLKH